jgi:hypothetical protein
MEKTQESRFADIGPAYPAFDAALVEVNARSQGADPDDAELNLAIQAAKVLGAEIIAHHESGMIIVDDPVLVDNLKKLDLR